MTRPRTLVPRVLMSRIILSWTRVTSIDMFMSRETCPGLRTVPVWWSHRQLIMRVSRGATVPEVTTGTTSRPTPLWGIMIPLIILVIEWITLVILITGWILSFIVAPWRNSFSWRRRPSTSFWIFLVPGSKSLLSS